MNKGVFERKVLMTCFGRGDKEIKYYITIGGEFKNSVFRHICEMTFQHARKSSDIKLETVYNSEPHKVISMFKKHSPYNRFLAQLMENPTSEEIESTILTDRDFVYFNNK